VIDGFETFPKRINRCPATRLSAGFVVSISWPISPFSPGAWPGQRNSVGSVAAVAKNPNQEQQIAVRMKLCMVAKGYALERRK
jgi:hypothetical protein